MDEAASRASARRTGTPSTTSSCARRPRRRARPRPAAVLLTGGEELAYDAPARRDRQRAAAAARHRGRGDVHALRTRGRRRSPAPALRPGARLLVVGAGFIGQEVAATARGWAPRSPRSRPRPRRSRRSSASASAAGSPGCTPTRASTSSLGDRPGRAARRRGRARRRAPHRLRHRRARRRRRARHGLAGRQRARRRARGDRRRPDVADRAARRLRRRRRHRPPALGGRRAPGRRRRARILGASPAPSRRRTSGATSTACASSASAPPRGADAVLVEGDQLARDFTAVFHRGRTPVAALLVGRPQATAGHAPADRRTPRTAAEERSMTYVPQIDEFGCSAHGDCAVIAPGDLPHRRHRRSSSARGAGPRHGGRRGVPRGGHLGRRRGDRPPALPVTPSAP